MFSMLMWDKDNPEDIKYFIALLGRFSRKKEEVRNKEEELVNYFSGEIQKAYDEGHNNGKVIGVVEGIGTTEKRIKKEFNETIAPLVGEIILSLQDKYERKSQMEIKKFIEEYEKKNMTVWRRIGIQGLTFFHIIHRKYLSFMHVYL